MSGIFLQGRGCCGCCWRQSLYVAQSEFQHEILLLSLLSARVAPCPAGQRLGLEGPPVLWPLRRWGKSIVWFSASGQCLSFTMLGMWRWARQRGPKCDVFYILMLYDWSCDTQGKWGCWNQRDVHMRISNLHWCLPLYLPSSLPSWEPLRLSNLYGLLRKLWEISIVVFVLFCVFAGFFFFENKFCFFLR